jgi:hypothetical protein
MTSSPEQAASRPGNKWLTSSPWKTAWKCLAACVALAFGCYKAWPQIELSDTQPLDAKDPYAWIFTISNKGLFWAEDLEAACFVREVIYEHGYQSDAWSYADAPITKFGRIASGQEFGCQCPKILWVFRDPKKKLGQLIFMGGADVVKEQKSATRGLAPLPIEAALVEVIFKYSVFVLPIGQQRRRLIARKTTDGALKWRRAGPDETILKWPADTMRFVLQRCKDDKGPGYSYLVTLVANPAVPPPACGPLPKPN